MAFWSDFLKAMKSTVFKNVLKNGDYSVQKLTNKRYISTDLGSESGGSFDGSSDVNIGVKNTLPIKHGGTGAKDAVNARKNLGIGNVATENVLPIAKGGTGATEVNDVKRNLGIPLSLTCGNTTNIDIAGEGWFKVFEIPHSGWVSYQLNMVIETANTFNLHTWTDSEGKKQHTLPVEFQLILRAEDNPIDSVLDRKMAPTVYVSGGNPTILNYFYIVQDTENATSGSYELWYKNPTGFALANVFVQNISSRNRNVDFNVIKIGDVNTAKPTYTAGKTAYCLYDHYSLNFPTIPIDKGGTGATSVDGALTNLGVYKSKRVYFSGRKVVNNTYAKICDLPKGAKLSDITGFAFMISNEDDWDGAYSQFYGSHFPTNLDVTESLVLCRLMYNRATPQFVGNAHVRLKVENGGLYANINGFHSVCISLKEGELSTLQTGFDVIFEDKYILSAIVYF
jgi:hypothetical protein